MAANIGAIYFISISSSMKIFTLHTDHPPLTPVFNSHKPGHV